MTTDNLILFFILLFHSFITFVNVSANPNTLLKESFKFLLPTYIRGANGALFFYNVSNYNSLAHIDDWFMIVKKEIRQEYSFPIGSLRAEFQ